MKIINITDEEYPKNLLKIKQPPPKLYVIGNEKLLNKKSIAIVGSRDCTEYGEKYAKVFAKQISQNNICIVSGMAMGIDAAAHEGALMQKGNTVAVLGCGFNNIYPKENINIFNKIIENNGCIITEYPPGAEVKLTNFPFRNRIISGLSMGVLVVEAKYRSGSSVTAKYAIQQNKKVFCIPGNIDSITSVGTNKLIQKGAKIVLSVEDILAEFNIKAIKTEMQEQIIVEKEYLDIYNVLEYRPININIISRKCNLGIAQVSQKLLIMEIKGYVKSMPGNEYVRR